MQPASPEVSGGRLRRLARRLRIPLALGAVAAVLAMLMAATSCHGHVIRSEHLPRGADDFDFRKFQCRLKPMPEPRKGEALIRYLGVSGLYIYWRDTAILTAPFFTRYGIHQLPFGDVIPDTDAIEEGMSGLPDAPIRAVLVGHSHFDHLADVPAILELSAKTATVYANRAGLEMIQTDEATNAFVELESHVGKWINIEDDRGDVLIRFKPLLSDHAPQLCFYDFANGKVKDPPWGGLDGRRLWKMQRGQTFAFLIDLMNKNGSIAFRMHYQDSASEPEQGFPSNADLDERRVDLAVVCMPSYWNAPGYPVDLLDRVQARHVLMSHYEDFFASPDDPRRFVALLTNDRANRLIGQVSEALEGRDLIQPTSELCGPHNEAWSMPIASEWLRFQTSP